MSMQQSEGVAEVRGVRSAEKMCLPPPRPAWREREHAARKAKRAARRDRERAEIAEAIRLGVDVVPKLRFDRFWTEAEDEAVRRHTHDAAALRAALPGRTAKAIESRRVLLLVADRAKPWTITEEKVLRAMAPKARTAADVACHLPGRSPSAVLHRLKRIGIPMRRPAADTGNSVVDAIKDRCRALGYTMRDLDRMAKTGRFWADGHFKRAVRHSASSDGSPCTMMSAAFTRALKALGGDLRVVWPDDGESIDTIEVGEG